MHYLLLLLFLVACSEKSPKTSQAAMIVEPDRFEDGYLIFRRDSVGFGGASVGLKSDNIGFMENIGSDFLTTGQTKNAFNETEFYLLKMKNDGTFEPTFGERSGYTISDEGQNGAGGATYKYERAHARYDLNGNIIAAGCSTYAGTSTSSYCPFTLWRFTPDGIKDSNFGYGKGHVIYNRYGAGFGGGSGFYRHEILGKKFMTFDSSNRIIVWGQSRTFTGSYVPFIARFESDGSIDTTFNSTGYYIGNESSFFANLIIDEQGRYVFGGQDTTPSGSVLTIWRMFPDGTLDMTFNTKGKAHLLNGLPGPAGASLASRNDCNSQSCDFIIDSNGHYVIAGSSRNAANRYEVVLARFFTSGSLDTSFNGTGYIVYNNNLPGIAGAGAPIKEDRVITLSLDPNQKYFITGHSRDPLGDQRIFMLRFHYGGTLETTFGGSGLVVITNIDGNAPGTSDITTSIPAFNSEGVILIPGWRMNSAGGIEPLIYRFLSNGDPDTRDFF